MQIREAAANDVPAFIQLIESYWAFEGIEGFEASRVEHLLHQLLTDWHLGAAWVAESPAGLVGYLIAVFTFSIEHGGLMAEIDEFFVVPSARSQGVGGKLLSAVERALSERGCVRVQLQLGRENVTAREFYCRRGYFDRRGYNLLEKPL